MPVEIHSKIIRDTAKEILSPHDIFQKGQSRIWIDDNGYYLTIIEFQPSARSKGSYLNIGLFFLWKEQDFISFDFPGVSCGGSRISFDEGKQFIGYENEEQFTERARFLAQIALDKAIYYRKFRDIDFAKKQMLVKQPESNSWNEMLFCLSTRDENVYTTVLNQREFWRAKGMKKLLPNMDILT